MSALIYTAINVMSSNKPTLFQRGKLVGEGLEGQIPIDYIVQWFAQRASKHGISERVLVLKSETASGKSTVIPPVLFRAGIRVGGKTRGMIVTQPRVLTAITNVSEIRKHNKFTDKEIGYSTKYDKLRPARSGLLSASLGTLTQQLINSTDDEIADRYQYIMIDEAHERSVDLDLTLTLLKGLVTRLNDRDDCPFLILASATFDPDDFLQYFGIARDTNFIWCQGANQNIDEMWEYMGDHVAKKYIDGITGIVDKISREDTDTRSDILVFLPGAAEITEVQKALMHVLAGAVKRDPASAFIILSIDRGEVNKKGRDYRALDTPLANLRQAVGANSYVPRRRVILSTVVAETGVTLPELKYVIDVGLSREVEYNPIVGATGLLTKPAPQSRIWQRRGRVGRNFPGVFYPLYPRYIYDKLQHTQYPDTVTSDCSQYILRLVSAQVRNNKARQYDQTMRITSHSNVFDPHDIDMVTPPPADSVCAAIRLMHNIGLMSQMQITPLGELALAISPLPPQHARAVLSSYCWNAPTAAVVHAMCYVLSELKSEKINWWEVYRAAGLCKTPAEYGQLRLAVADQFIDGAVLYAALECNSATLSSFCNTINVKREDVATFVETVDDTLSAMILAELNIGGRLQLDSPEQFTKSVSAIKHCIYDGFSQNLFVLRNQDRMYAQVSNPRVVIRVPDMLADTVSNREASRATGAKISVLPKFILTDGIAIKSANNTYVLRAKYISVLDGYLSPDLHYGY